jgi:hypothetical protein
MEIRAAQGETTPPRSRLMPIYERPRSPPKRPLPKLPGTNAKRSGQLGPPISQTDAFSFEKDSEDVLAPAFLPKVPPRVDQSPVHSTPSERSYMSSEKGNKALGMDGPKEPSTSTGIGLHQNHTSSGSESAHAFPPHPRIKMTRPTNTGNPLAENSFEDTEMDERSRQLSFSQDYHDLLADQYQELRVQPEEVLRAGPRKDSITDPIDMTARPKHPLEEQPLRPQPLSWHKESNANSLRSASGAGASLHDYGFAGSETASSNKRKRGRLASLVPRRLSVGLQRNVSLKSALNSLEHGKRSKRDHDLDADKPRTDAFDFSKFFAPGMPFHLGRKSTKGKATNKRGKEKARAPPLPKIAPSAPTPLIRLPGGLAVVRTPPQVPNSEQASLSGTSTPGEQQQQHPIPALAYENTSTPTSNLSHRSSYSYHGPKRVATLRSAYNAARSASISRKRSSTPLPAPQFLPSAEHSPERSPVQHAEQHAEDNAEPRERSGSAWKRWSNGPDTVFRTPSFLAKAKERRKSYGLNRHDELKKSIRVLGPTDTGTVEIQENNGRQPGYLVS